MPDPIVPRRLFRAVLAAVLLGAPAGAAVAQDPAVPGDPAASPTPAPSAAASTPGAPGPAATDQAARWRPSGAWSVGGYDAFGEGPVAPPTGVPYTLLFLDAGRLEGDAGCGTLFGGYVLDGERLSVSVTNKGLDPCGPRRIEAAVNLTQALAAVSSWRAGADGLVLLDDAGTVRVELQPLSRAGPDGDWVVSRVARADGTLAAVAEPGTATLLLQDDGTFSGTTGCRYVEGQWFRDAGRVTIVRGDTTGLPCEGDGRRLERRLLRALDTVTHWERDGDTLRLADAAAGPLVELVEASSVVAATTSPQPSTLPGASPGAAP